MAAATAERLDSLQRLRDALGGPVTTIRAYADCEPDPADPVTNAVGDLCRRYLDASQEPDMDEFTEWVAPLLAALKMLSPRERWALARGVYDAGFVWTAGGFELWRPIAELSSKMG
jgi:hypothetical protein